MYSGSGGYATIKYSSAGVPLWTNSYNFYYLPGYGDSSPQALALDSSGNVFVTGSSGYNGNANRAIATVGYSSSGIPLFTNRYIGPGHQDCPSDLAVDASGNVFVAGGSATSDSTPSAPKGNLVTIKYVIPPIIIRQPVSCTNAAGTSASFSVEVAGSAPFTYQWCRDGSNLADGGNISGVTSTNLLIANVQAEDAGGYSVVVTNANGSVTSVVARLTVVVPPSAGRFTTFKYSAETGFSFIFRDATVGQPYRIQRSHSMAEGSWVDWQSFTYSEPIFLADLGATGQERRFYRAVSP
jgi:hypothetical protein